MRPVARNSHVGIVGLGVRLQSAQLGESRLIRNYVEFCWCVVT